MRDDVQKLADSLIDLTIRKKNIMSNINDRAKMLGSFIMSGHFSKMDDIFEEDRASIDDINLIDFEIRKTSDEICSKAGIRIDQLDRFFSEQEKDFFRKYSDLRNQIKSIAKEKSASLDKAISALEKEMKDTIQAIDARTSIERVKKIIGE